MLYVVNNTPSSDKTHVTRFAMATASKRKCRRLDNSFTHM